MEELLNSYGLYFIFKKFINTYWKILHFKCNKLWLEIKIVFRNIKKIAKDAAKVLNFRLDMTTGMFWTVTSTPFLFNICGIWIGENYWTVAVLCE